MGSLRATMNSRVRKLVPWESWQLWNNVREAIFSSSPSRISAALDKIAAWRTRGSLPVAVEVTGELIRIQRMDPFFSACSATEDFVTNEMLCLMYAMAIMRLINGVVDHSKKQNMSSVAARAEMAGLPRILVDIRHEVAHQELPTLPYLQLASKQALEWLKDHYWDPQKQLLNEVQNGLCAKLNAYASLAENSENKGLQAGQKQQMQRAKKLAVLSSPGLDLFNDSNIKIDLDSSTSMERPKVVPENLDHMICNDELMDAEFQKSDDALLRARKRLRTFYQTNPTILFTRSSADHDVQDNTVDTYMSTGNSIDTPEKPSKGHTKNKSSRKAAWSVANDWKPCAIGMLPSKTRSAGVLPYFGSMFADLARESACQALDRGKLSSEVEVGVSLKEALGFDTIMQSNSLEEASFVEAETEEGGHKQTGTEAQQIVKKQPCEANARGHSDALPPSGKSKPPFSGGFLLLDGLYQRCGVSQLEAIRSSIEVLK